MKFYNSYFLLLLFLVPAACVFFALTQRWRRNALLRFGSPDSLSRLTEGISRPRQLLKFITGTLALAFLILALARPQYGVKAITLQRTGIDIVIALDTSESMNAEDIKPSRFQKARFEIHKFVDAFQGNRIGLVSFAGESFVECPLTLDYGAVKLFLDSMDVGIIPVPGTNISGAIRKSVEALTVSSAKSKILLLVTDGEDNEGNAVREAKTAGKKGIRIYTVGIGDTRGVPIPTRDKTGQVVGYKKDRDGKTVLSKLDVSTLEQIALYTDGKFLNPTQGDLGLDLIAEDIKGMEKTDIMSEKLTRYEDRYQVFLLLAILLLIVEWLIPERTGRSLAPAGRIP
jgi:Ca-activated chloride channel family protein